MKFHTNEYLTCFIEHSNDINEQKKTRFDNSDFLLLVEILIFVKKIVR